MQDRYSRIVCLPDATVLTYRYGGWLWAMLDEQPLYEDLWIEVVW